MSKHSKDSDVNIENSWIFLAKDGCLNGGETFILNLKHPGHYEKTKFLLSKSTNKIYEIQIFDDTYRSWLIDDTLRKNGNIYVCTPMDPLFLILPHLKEQCSTRAIPLEHILQLNDDSELKEIYGTIKDLNSIGDLKGPKNLNAYKYNEEKTLNWLDSKVKNVVSILKNKKLHVKPGSVAATFIVSSLSEEIVDEEYYLKYAFGLVCEYLNEDFVQLLQSKLDIKIESETVKRKSDDDVPNASKKIKRDSDASESNMTSDYFSSNLNTDKKSKPVTLSAKEKQRQKAATGTKNIASFFSKKS